MAFNFQWSPLTADTSFYARAKDLLTAALNKSPKPAIIVDDILVDELNLGSLPPDLEVLEIGDLAVDRFRGMFKMCYAGDAFLTLRTRVQANPLKTSLSTKPLFTSPEPLAAASGLTIPIQITLSDIRLSAFITLVYSCQKGVTLVFRNDPLESLKVSSTFDAIPFVRDYLQKEIEKQLRALLMDELPLIIHRLSLHFFNKEQQEGDRKHAAGDLPIDPLASPPQDPVDSSGSVLDASEIASLSLDPTAESHNLFSRKNLLQLGALVNSHRTLSLFTPNIQDAVFRVWAFPDRSTSSGKDTPAHHIRPHYTSTELHGNLSSPIDFDIANQHNRQGLGSANGSQIGRGSRNRNRKKKRRVVNLRKQVVEGSTGPNSPDDFDESGSVSVSEGSSTTGTVDSTSAPSSTEPLPISINLTRPTTPDHVTEEPGDTDIGNTPPQFRHLDAASSNSETITPRQSQYLLASSTKVESETIKPKRHFPAGAKIRPPRTPLPLSLTLSPPGSPLRSHQNSYSGLLQNEDTPRSSMHSLASRSMSESRISPPGSDASRSTHAGNLSSLADDVSTPEKGDLAPIKQVLSSTSTAPKPPWMTVIASQINQLHATSESPPISELTKRGSGVEEGQDPPPAYQA